MEPQSLAQTAGSSTQTTAPYGTWESKITLDSVTSQNNNLGGVHVCPLTKRVYIDEGRPNGNTCILEILADGTTHDVLSEQFSARSTVHEYGGGAWEINCAGQIVFSNASDNQVYILDVDTSEVSCIVAAPERRYADFDPHPQNERWILAIEENHETSSIQNSLVLIDQHQRTTTVLVKGADFYTAPRFAPDGLSFCWLQWDHPEMPWTGAELFWAKWHAGLSSVTPKYLAGGEARAAGEPRWSQDGTLYFLQELSDFRQLYRFPFPQNGISEEVKLPKLLNLEFGRAEWQLRSTSYIFLSPKSMVAILTKYGAASTFLIDLDAQECSELELPIRDATVEGLSRHSQTSFFLIGSTETCPTSLYEVEIKSKIEMKKLRTGSKAEIPASLFSRPEQLADISSNGLGHVYGFYLPPHNPEFKAPEDQKPPLIVFPHGGPTAHWNPGLLLSYQFWTSRGFAVCLLNYHGSSGHGRIYRNSLNTKWGILDPKDAITAINHLCLTGRADSSRVGICGGSSGGYCVLQSVTLFPEAFAGAISLYGISDLKLLNETTHKFESHYSERLLFEKAATEEEREAILRERSPIYHAKNISCPLLLLQGGDDHVVPVSQAKKMAEEISSNGGNVKLVIYPGEGHGFRKAKNNKASITEQLNWWLKTLVRSQA